MPNPRRPGIRSRQSLQSSQTSSGAYNTVPAPSFKKTDRFAEKIAQELAQKGPATYLEREAAASTAVSKYERINPSRVSALKTIRRRFEEYVGASRQAWVKTGKRLPPNHDHPSFLVLENTLLLYSATFIYTLGRLLVGRGGLALRGSTLEKLANTFMTFITMFAQTTDGSSVGPELLKRQVSSVGQRDSRGAFVRKTLKDSIKDAVSSAIESFDLAKEQLPRYWFGLNETKMLVNYLLRNAAASPSKADAKIQLAIAMLISFLMGVRVGSIAPSYQPWATESRYLRVKDVELYRDIDGRLRSRWTFKSLKGHYNSTDGFQLCFDMSSPSYRENICLDISFLFALLMFRRGYLPDYQTFDLFLDDRRPGAIKIQDGLSGTSPVVTEHAQGGRELKDTPRPMLATNLISAMKRTCKALNLPQTGFHAFRRNFAQEIKILRGDKAASLALGHKDNSSMADSVYCGETVTWDLLRDRTRESPRATRSSDLAEATHQNAFYSPAMAAKVRLSNQAHDESTPEEDMHLPTQEEFKQAMKNLQDEEADIDWQSDVFQLKNQLGREFDASIREEASSDKSSQADTEESRRLMAKELLNREYPKLCPFNSKPRCALGFQYPSDFERHMSHQKKVNKRKETTATAAPAPHRKRQKVCSAVQEPLHDQFWVEIPTASPSQLGTYKTL